MRAAARAAAWVVRVCKCVGVWPRGRSKVSVVLCVFSFLFVLFFFCFRSFEFFYHFSKKKKT